MEELSEEARRLGLVMDNETVAALERADRQVEIAQQRIDTAVRQAVAGLADEFVDLSTAIADSISWLARLLDKMGELTRLSQARNPNALNSPASGLGTWVNLRLRGYTQEQIDFMAERRGASVDQLRGAGLGAPLTPPRAAISTWSAPRRAAAAHVVGIPPPARRSSAASGPSALTTKWRGWRCSCSTP